MNDLFRDEPPPFRVDADGVIRLIDSRITVLDIQHWFFSGLSPEDARTSREYLDLGTLYSAFGWYLRHRDELAEYFAARNAEEEIARGELSAGQHGVKDRLLGRQRRKSGGFDL